MVATCAFRCGLRTSTKLPLTHQNCTVIAILRTKVNMFDFEHVPHKADSLADWLVPLHLGEYVHHAMHSRRFATVAWRCGGSGAAP